MKLDVYDFESYLKHSFLYICSNSLLYSSASFHNFIHIELVYFLLQLFFIILLFLLELQQGFFFHFIVSLDIVCTYEGYWITWQLENNTYRLTYVLLIYLFILLSWNHYFSVHFSLAGVHCSVILSGMVNSWVKKNYKSLQAWNFIVPSTLNKSLIWKRYLDSNLFVHSIWTYCPYSSCIQSY